MPSGGDDQRPVDEPPFGERLLLQLTGPEGTGYAMSLAIHLGLMLALALTIYRHVRPGALASISISTVVEATPLSTNVPVEMQLPRLESEARLAAAARWSLSPPAADSDALQRLLSHPVSTGARGTAEGAGSTQGDPDSEPPLPRNAVRAGSFAAWWIPIAVRYGEVVEPGQLPRPGQAYHIYVQIRVPGGRPAFRLDDLSGEIVGTDGYRQQIPDRALIHDEKGSLVKSAGRGHARVQQGLAVIVFRVEGAGRAGIRDTISIRSRTLGEEQQLTLEFQPEAPAGG